MEYQPQILGLIIMFLLIVFYWFRSSKCDNKDSVYKYLLILVYLLNLTEITSSIAKITLNGINFYQKLYFVIALLAYLTIPFYMVSTYIKDRYRNQASVVEKKFIVIRRIYIVALLMTIFLTISTNIMVKGKINNLIFLLLGLDLLTMIIFLIKNNKQINPKISFHFWIVFFINTLSVISQYYIKNLSLLTIGSVINVLYLYLTLENMGLKELESLRIENSYNKEQNIDKVAFLKNISHEIRTPINTIDGFSQMIIDNDDLSEIKKDVADIRIASRDLIDVINGMIDLSIIESGNLEIISENYNIYDMFDTIIDITKSKLREKKVDFKVEIDNNIPEVLWGDSERISQLILNLLKYSIRYTDKGEINLKVTRIKSDTICRLKVEVSSTGKTLTKEEISQIFNLKEQKEQTNLNLSVSNYLVEKMNGSLEVDNTYTEGTCFIVTLDQKINSEHQERATKKEKVLKPFKATGKRILLVDDNKLNLKVATRLLSPYQVTVTEANSGQECLDILEYDHDFDLILMDDLMPGLSGTETMNLIKKIERIDGYYIPITAVTANATAGQKEKYLEMGFDDYLSKPIVRYELDLILKKYLKGNLSK